jgi:hypothetical protein
MKLPLQHAATKGYIHDNAVMNAGPVRNEAWGHERVTDVSPPIVPLAGEERRNCVWLGALIMHDYRGSIRIIRAKLFASSIDPSSTGQGSAKVVRPVQMIAANEPLIGQ